MATLLNEGQIKTILELDHGGELLERLVNIFETDIPPSIKALEIAINNGQIDSIKKISHSIKSSSLNIGAAELANIAGQLESISDINTNHTTQLDQLRRCFISSIEGLKGYLNS